MRVRAKSMCFVDGIRRRPGAVFDVPQTASLPKWLEPVDAQKADEPASDEPSTFAELNAKNDDAPVKYGGRKAKPGYKANQEESVK